MFKDKTLGPADKRKGTKRGKAPHPAKLDDNFGSKTNYADLSKTKIHTGGGGGPTKGK